MYIFNFPHFVNFEKAREFLETCIYTRFPKKNIKVFITRLAIKNTWNMFLDLKLLSKVWIFFN